MVAIGTKCASAFNHPLYSAQAKNKFKVQVLHKQNDKINLHLQFDDDQNDENTDELDSDELVADLNDLNIEGESLESSLAPTDPSLNYLEPKKNTLPAAQGDQNSKTEEANKKCD